MALAREDGRGVAVPRGAFTRMSRLGGTTAGIVGRAAIGAAGQALRGRAPQMDALLLTPKNIRNLTEQLAQMRGAAMKVGQLMSMEGEDILPPELAKILERLRADAYQMPPKDLKAVLARHWGPDFLRQFRRFDVRPIAAASIGQVHRAQTRDGRDLAIKVQYPGVRDSIDSDVRNIGRLLALPGLLPRGYDIKPLLRDVTVELHHEADYAREAGYLERFHDALRDRPHFVVPQVHADLSSEDILVMDYMDSQPIEDLQSAPQEVRDRIMTQLITLMLDELFDLGAMQTDPNFANYRYQPQSGRVVLLDFGAAGDISAEVSARYLALLHAGLAGTRSEVDHLLTEIGFMTPQTKPHHRGLILDIFEMAISVLRDPAPFDFGTSTLAQDVRDKGMAFAEDRDFDAVPPVQALLIQRKIGGLFLLGQRLRARIPLQEIIAPYAARQTI